MNKVLSLILSLLFAAGILSAQEQACVLSNPINSSETGVYKVLCMQNGNTMLLHMEPSKPVGVKIFDSTHKLIAVQEHECHELNTNTFKTSVFKGLFEINGEAVLFFQQPHINKQLLVRVRIDGTNGRITDEEIIGQSKSLAKPMQFYVMQNKRSDGYSVLYCTDVPQFKECEVTVKYYSNKHEITKEMPIPVDRKPYDYMGVVGADELPEGTCITLRFSELKVNGTFSGIGRDPKASVYEYYLGVYYIPKDSSIVHSRVLDLTTDFSPYYVHSTYNHFAKSVNILALSYRDILLRNGLEMLPSALTAVLFLKYDDESGDIHHNWINNQIANTYLKQRTDTNHWYQGIPVKYFTTKTGLSTVVSEAYNRHNSVETNARANVHETFFGNIGITQFDDEGEEIWGTVLPLSQYYKSYRQYYPPTELGKRYQDQDLFSDLPAQVHERQFVSLNVYARNNNHYIIANDLKENLNSNLAKPGDTVFSCLTASAVCYKVNRKNEVNKYSLLGECPEAEHRASFIEGADFDEKRGVYATLVQVRRGDYTALRMAWCKLD
jgi:hypothetical protein